MNIFKIIVNPELSTDEKLALIKEIVMQGINIWSDLSQLQFSEKKEKKSIKEKIKPLKTMFGKKELGLE